MAEPKESNIGKKYNHDGGKYKIVGVRDDDDMYEVRTVADDTFALHGVNIVHNALD